MNKDISIIICTYNRCESLKETLDSLCSQEHDGLFNYEVIVVDNNSTDKTKEVVEDYTERFNGRFRYALEPNQGLSNARNKGIKEAKGEIIAFTDDDCIVDKKWLLNIYETYKKYEFDALGGRILPIYPENTPQWIKDNNDLLCGPIVFHDYGEDIKRHQNPMSEMIGANMAFRSKVFQEVGLFHPDLGAGKGTMGDETELIRRLRKRQLKIYYCGKALVFHPIENERTNLEYIAKWNISYGRFEAKNLILLSSKPLAYCFGAPRYLYREVIKNFLLLICSFYNRRSFLNYYMHFFRKIGMIKEFRKLSACQTTTNPERSDG